MSLISSWVLLPLLLAAVGAGWGVIVERLAGTRIDGVLLVPLGLAAAIVVAGTLTAFSATAPASVPVVAIGAIGGLLLLWPTFRLGPIRGSARAPLPGRWPALAALGALLVYGAPILLSGHATFTGIVKLDDTSTWLNITDNVMSHGRSLSSLPPSTFSLVAGGYVGSFYPLGSFMLLGVGHGLTGIDSAWIFQPYLACCAAAIALSAFALAKPFVPSPKIRALVAFLSAQPALLYGYGLWGGIKELTAAFTLALTAALAAPLLSRAPGRARELLPPVVAAAALIQSLGVGAGGWIVPALGFVVLVWILRGRTAPKSIPGARTLAYGGAFTAAVVAPVALVLRSFLNGDAGLFSAGQSTSTQLGNLGAPLSGWQLAGIWPSGDFRLGRHSYAFLQAPSPLSAFLICTVVLAALVGLWATVRRRQLGPALYLTTALGGCAILYLAGTTPWVTGKALAISSPALLASALIATGALWSRRQARPIRATAGSDRRIRALARHAWFAGMLATLAIGGGVLWSNALAYHDATLAPRDRMAELQRIGELVAGKGPTLLNEYEVYGDRHFLRAGAPIEPAEYRPALLELRDGRLLTKSAWADLDSFPVATLLTYRSIVLRRSPSESRPPSIYKLVWKGRYYELWQRPANPSATILEHVPYGESNTLPYCGASQNGPSANPCSLNPVAVPSCPQVHLIAHRAFTEHAHLVAFRHAEPIVARGDQTLWPAQWIHDASSHTLTPTSPGQAVAHIAVAGAHSYELWLDGSFARGFVVSVDGRRVGSVKNELGGDGWVQIADVSLAPGVHTFTIAYPPADDLTPGSGDASRFTSLSAVALQPHEDPASELLTLAPSQAQTLCGRPVDWIEIVAGAG